MSQAVAVQNSGEDLELLLTTHPVVAINCFATWCGPCQVTSPFINRLAREYERSVTVLNLDVDRDKEWAKKLGVRSIPTVLIFKQGELMETIVGVTAYETFCEAIDRYL